MYYDYGFTEEVNKKLKEYKEVFKEEFPLMEFEGNEKQLINTINKCMKSKNEYVLKYQEDEED